MATTPRGALRYPVSSSTPNVPQDIQNLATDVDALIPVVKANQAAIVAITSPYVGMRAFDLATKRSLYYNGSNWVKYGGPREVLYENGNAGSSGIVNVGAGATGVLSVNVPAPAVAADTGHLHMLAAVVTPTGSTVGQIAVTVAGVGYSQIFNTGAATIPQPVVVEMPFSLPASAFTVGVTLNCSAGNAAQISYSAFRVTY